jgi:hypothetical protein
MKESKGNNNNKKENEMERYKDFFNSFNDVSETDEILHQLANLNFVEDKQKLNKNYKVKGDNISKIQFENYNNNSNKNITEDQPISLVLLKEKINRIYISMQGLNFQEKELDNLNNFIPFLN